MRFLGRTLDAVYFAPEGEGGGSGAGDPPGGSEGAETWYGKAGIAAEHHEWLAGKQFADANLAIASHRSLEGLIGRQRLAVPKDASDAEAYDAIYKTLGRPDKADGYKLKDGSKINGEAAKPFFALFHKAGISQAQADIVLGGYEAEAARLSAAAETERTNQENAQIAKLDAEWGSAKDANRDIAARAFRALGIDEATSDKIEGAIGYYATMKLFHAIGSGMSEASFKQDGNKGGAGNLGGSLEGERNKLQDKFKDKEFMARYMHNDPRVRKEAIDEVEVIQKRIADLTTGKG